MLITRFEDIEVWQASRELTNMIYQITSNRHFSQDYALKDQIRRSSISVMANIAEGFGRKSKREFIQFLRYSISSAVETKSHLYLALDFKYITKDQFTDLADRIETIVKRTKAFIRYLNEAKK